MVTQYEIPDFANPIGVPLGKVLMDRVPEPSHTLEWGKDISPEILQALRNGETATLNDEKGNPYSTVLMDMFGNIREKRHGRI